MDALLNNPWFQTNGLFVASAVVALAVGWFSWQMARIVTYPRNLLGDSHPFERQRRDELRAGSKIYRLFEPVIEEIATFIGRRERDSMTTLQRALVAGREKLPWRPQEFVAVKWIEAILAGAVV